MSEILLLDNFDSFVYNLVDQLKTSFHKVIVYRNNISISKINKKILNMKNPILMLSPGPGNPLNSGNMMKILYLFKGKIPIIGICLGYQAIIQSYGGKIYQLKKMIHGKSSIIYHDQKYMFKKIKNPLSVARYHSLTCKNIPKKLKINSKIKKLAMSVRDNKNRICGFQFHPESILTTHGKKILDNTILWANN
ncbi:MAG: aminodeoxychorismate/anthranilate synthase component II [Buchnera aphidicola (Periphyllus lyropictus)]|uniref:aminodeoxychorismate/anthranilate synthase component II n=1 Tax=Buchnera aphidicola TaxID=9 RepID=UPI001ECE333A|nr:aminodeoxychorismate/anthranilate synthase component II [Buchnera aphidicola]NIH16849.1 aminodeoxychorismate/anthranilate synthase component II [Buchnera aphidicola (Periphyllus lyropictus)]USS94719.1 aminodeoxychorismate/anthranilate synthase component II [Buchnera aphidicola (Periphyllus lyropictus)]